MVNLGDRPAAHYSDLDPFHGVALRAAKSFQALARSTVRPNSSDNASHISLRAAWAAASSPAASAFCQRANCFCWTAAASVADRATVATAAVWRAPISAVGVVRSGYSPVRRGRPPVIVGGG